MRVKVGLLIAEDFIWCSAAPAVCCWDATTGACAQSLFPMTTQAFMHHEAPREHTRPASAAKAQAGAGPHKVSLKQATVQAERRFPAPWTFEYHNDACFIVKDANGLAVAYAYYEEGPGRRAAANLMTKEEARRIAANIAKLPELLRQ